METEMKINMPESILDLPLGRYLQIIKSILNIPKDNAEEYFSTAAGTLHLIDLVEYFIGESPDDLPVSELERITSRILELCNKEEKPEWRESFQIEGIKYMTRNLEGMYDISFGELVSLKVYQEKYSFDFYEYIPYVLAILVRPASEIRDEETGELRLVMEKFNKKDIENLEWRANMFKEKVSARELLFVSNFFLNMKE